MKTEDALREWGDYQGRQDKPDDFDDFWDKAKKEVDSLGLHYELTPTDFTSKVAECYDLYFTGVHESKIYAQLLLPKKSSAKHPVIFQFHGYHSDVGDWSDKLAFVSEGYVVVALSVRGQGGESEDRLQTSGGTLKGHLIRGIEDGPEKLFYRAVFQDVYQLTNVVSRLPFVDSSKMASYGVSQGGALALVCAALCPKVKRTFVQYPFLSDYRTAYGLEVTQSAYEELAYYFRYRDPLHEREKAVFAALDYVDIQYLVDRIQAEVIWAMGLEDRVCHPKTQFAVYNHIQAPKKLYFYPEYGHEYLPKFNDKIHQILGGK